MLREQLQQSTQSLEWLRVENIGLQTHSNFAMMDAMNMRVLVDALARERDAARQECDTLRGEVFGARQECDQLRSDLAAVDDGEKHIRAPSPASGMLLDFDEDSRQEEDATDESLVLRWLGARRSIVRRFCCFLEPE